MPLDGITRAFQFLMNNPAQAVWSVVAAPKRKDRTGGGFHARSAAGRQRPTHRSRDWQGPERTGHCVVLSGLVYEVTLTYFLFVPVGRFPLALARAALVRAVALPLTLLVRVLQGVLQPGRRAAVTFVLRAALERVRLAILVFGEAEELRLRLVRAGLRVDARLEVLPFALGERRRCRGLRLVMFLSPYVRT